jgi:hypothetical protein
MQVSEKVEKYVAALPPPLQDEVLHFVECLLAKTEDEVGRQEIKAWMMLSLSSAMQGMEDEESVSYSLSDVKVHFL